MKEMAENWEVYADWNPWHGCTKISPGCKIKKKRDKSWKIESGKIVFTCFTSDFLLKDADRWRCAPISSKTARCTM